jgi:hypothetical protein
LEFDPKQRLTADQAFNHPFLNNFDPNLLPYKEKLSEFTLQEEQHQHKIEKLTNINIDISKDKDSKGFIRNEIIHETKLINNKISK